MTNFIYYCRMSDFLLFLYYYYFRLGDSMNNLEIIRLLNKMIDNTRTIKLSYAVDRLTIDKYN